LASTNSAVIDWNLRIQSMNPSPEITCVSNDYLCEVDDVHGYLENMTTEACLNAYNNNSAPPHLLKLKVNDICLVMRALMVDNIASNSRVQILSILPNVIWVKTLSERVQRIVAIPKVRFKFRLTYGESFCLMRTQFPLRLAYAMTMNKSQSQTLRRTLVDCRQPPFSHGHLYVASSRVRSAQDIRYYFDCNDELVNLHKCSVVQNVVYQELLL
jgi:ATP-dependent DNA helicase PIF1